MIDFDAAPDDLIRSFRSWFEAHEREDEASMVCFCVLTIVLFELFERNQAHEVLELIAEITDEARELSPLRH